MTTAAVYGLVMVAGAALAAASYYEGDNAALRDWLIIFWVAVVGVEVRRSRVTIKTGADVKVTKRDEVEL